MGVEYIRWLKIYYSVVEYILFGGWIYIYNLNIYYSVVEYILFGGWIYIIWIYIIRWLNICYSLVSHSVHICFFFYSNYWTLILIALHYLLWFVLCEESRTHLYQPCLFTLVPYFVFPSLCHLASCFDLFALIRYHFDFPKFYRQNGQECMITLCSLSKRQLQTLSRSSKLLNQVLFHKLCGFASGSEWQSDLNVRMPVYTVVTEPFCAPRCCGPRCAHARAPAESKVENAVENAVENVVENVVEPSAATPALVHLSVPGYLSTFNCTLILLWICRIQLCGPAHRIRSSSSERVETEQSALFK